YKERLGRLLDSNLGTGPARLHRGPGIGGALGGVDQQNAGSSLPLCLLDLVRPPAIVGQNGAPKDAGVSQTGVVDEGNHDLVFDVESTVIVPLILRRNDAIAHEHQIAFE